MSELSVPLRPARLKTGHPLASSLPVSSYFFSSLLIIKCPPPSAPSPFPPEQDATRADVADLVIQIWATLSVRGSPLFSSNWIFHPTVIRVLRTEKTL